MLICKGEPRLFSNYVSSTSPVSSGSLLTAPPEGIKVQATEPQATWLVLRSQTFGTPCRPTALALRFYSKRHPAIPSNPLSSDQPEYRPRRAPRRQPWKWILSNVTVTVLDLTKFNQPVPGPSDRHHRRRVYLPLVQN